LIYYSEEIVVKWRWRVDGMSDLRVLIVEDEEAIALVIRATLKSLGYAVVGAVSSGEQAIEKAIELQPDLILMDILLLYRILLT
jgi:CheY-like chemotaxis protein